MTRYGTLRMWAAMLMPLGGLAVLSALAGGIIWAIEVEGFWRTAGALLLTTAAAALGMLLVAIAQALQAVADIGETVRAR